MAVGDQETIRLKPSKLRYIARRSGQPLEDLQKMLDVADLQGRRISVTYDVVAERRGDPIGRVIGR